jgi:cytochrome P460
MVGNRILSAIALSLSIAFAQQAFAQSPNVPKYTGDMLLFPDGFRTWVFVGSNLGLTYKGEATTDAPTFHNVYINPEAYAYFRDKGEFPDPTIFVIDMFASATKEPQHIVAKGSYDGTWAGNLVAVKNSARPPGPKGEKTIWAYYIFTDPAHPSQPAASAAAQPDDNCEACHKLHGLKDHVWVQFYPTLRDLKK